MRICMYIIGICILSFGVVLNTKTGLGVSAINSLPYALSIIFHQTLGTMTMVMYFIFVGVQCVLTRKDFKMKTLLQILVSIGFGRLTDLFNNNVGIVSSGPVISYLLLACAIFLTALGMIISVNMNLVPNAPDGMVRCFSVAFSKDFGKAKTTTDTVMVVLTVLLCLVTGNKIIGIGIGTVISAIFIGRCATLLGRGLKKPFSYFF